jgi:hypothetical protein
LKNYTVSQRWETKSFGETSPNQIEFEATQISGMFVTPDRCQDAIWGYRVHPFCQLGGGFEDIIQSGFYVVSLAG